MTKRRPVFSTRIKFMAGTTVIFAVSMVLLGAVAFYAMRSSLEQQLRDHVSIETSHLLGDYADHGLPELQHDIRERTERGPSSRLRYSIQNADKVAIFDRFPVPEKEGWSLYKNDNGLSLIVLSTRLEDGYWLGIGAETRSIDEFAVAFRTAMIFVLIATPFLSALAGFFISRRFLKHITNIRIATEKVGRGSLSERIPQDDHDDDFAQLVAAINAMLTKIEHLVHDVQYVSVSIAHDLRTPLTRLRQRLEVLQEKQQTDEGRDMCDGAITALDEALGIFSSLMRIAELDAGASDLTSELVRLDEVLKNLVQVYEPIVQDENKTIALHNTMPGTALISGDAQLLTQLFSNLIENAIRHNLSPINIMIELHENNERLEARVRDDGIGIPEEKRKEIIKPFFRVDADRQKSGAGLGLSLAERIAFRHHAEFILEDASPGLLVRVIFPKTQPL